MSLPFKTIAMISVACIALSGCGWIGGGQSAARQEAPRHHNAALGYEDALRLGMKSLHDGGIVPAALHGGAVVSSQRETTQSDGLSILRAAISDIQSVTGRADNTAWFDHQQKLRHAFIMARGAGMIGGEIRAALHTPPAHADLGALDTLREFYTLLEGGKRDLNVLMGRNLNIDPGPLPALSALPDLADLEIMALVRRAEIRMEMDQGIETHALRRRALDTFPGVTALLERKRDRNPEIWARFANSYGQSLTRLFTMPLQMRDDDIRARLNTLRQDALAAAILAQLHMAHDRYSTAYQHHQMAQAMVERTRENPADQVAALNARAALVVATARLHLAHADILHAVGMDALENSTPPEPEIQQASLSRMMAMPPIPFARKISATQSAETDGLENTNTKPSSFLKISTHQLRKLLDAPISEP